MGMKKELIKTSKNKERSNKFRVRHEYIDAAAKSSFKVMKKYDVDIEWWEKIRYETSEEVILTEKEFNAFVNAGVFQKATTQTAKKVAEVGHFGNDHDLFNF